MAERPVTAPARGFGWEPGTMRKAALVGGALLLLVGALTWALHEPAAKGPMAHYLRMGAGAGTVALQRDLSETFPAGSPLPPLLARLDSLGFRCHAPGPEAIWTCNQRLQPRPEQQFRAMVVISLRGDNVAGLTAQLERLNQ